MSILQTIDLKKYYGTEPNITRALDGVNFSVEDGEFVAVVGTSGSGKSTLLHMMGGLDTPTSGNVIVRDKELSKIFHHNISFPPLLNLLLFHCTTTSLYRDCSSNLYAGSSSYLLILFSALSAFAVVG